MGESLLELWPGSLSRSAALTRSDRGGARLGGRAGGLDVGAEVVSGAWVLEGAEFCAQAPRLQASNEIRTKLRIALFYRHRCWGNQVWVKRAWVNQA